MVSEIMRLGCSPFLAINSLHSDFTDRTKFNGRAGTASTE